jgi:hypothetical protein
MLLEQKLGGLAVQDRRRVNGLNSSQLAELTKALLNFQDAQSLSQWLQKFAAES